MSEGKAPNVDKWLRRNLLKWIVLVLVAGVTVGWLFDPKWIQGCILLALIWIAMEVHGIGVGLGMDLTIIRRAVVTMGDEEPLAVRVQAIGISTGENRP